MMIKKKKEEEEEWERRPYKHLHSRYQKRFHRALAADERQCLFSERRNEPFDAIQSSGVRGEIFGCTGCTKSLQEEFVEIMFVYLRICVCGQGVGPVHKIKGFSQKSRDNSQNKITNSQNVCLSRV